MKQKNSFESKVKMLLNRSEQWIQKQNKISKKHFNGIFDRYKDPVLTRRNVPVEWCYDLNPNTNPHLMERLEINSVFNTGAIYWNGEYVLIPRIESNDVKSFFGVASSKTGIDQFTFWEYPIVMPETDNPDMNVYDIRLTEHEDGYIYGTFCTERKDTSRPLDSSAAIANCGIARTKDLIQWERLPDLVTPSPQQRNVVLHPEFVDGAYAFYTRPMDGFIETGELGGICWGTCKDIEHAVIDREVIMDPKQYHTIKEVKNGLGPTPIKTTQGWLHLGHGVRRTAAGLRYTLYMFLCDLNKPWEISHFPGRHFLAPIREERVGDVSNVVFSNGWIHDSSGNVFIYYGSSDTRVHVVTTTLEKLIDYVMNTPPDAGRSYACVQQRIDLINKNKEFMVKD